MRFVHIKPINPKLFKRDHIILLLVSLQLFELDMQALFRPFKLLDRKSLSAALF